MNLNHLFNFGEQAQANWIVLGVLIAVNIPIYWLLVKLFFNDFEGLLEAVGYWFTPDLWSMFQDRFLEDWWAELKLSLWLGLCSAVTYGEYSLLQDYFPDLIQMVS